MTRPRRRSQAARSAAARERVLQAALQAIATNGYQGSSLARIAEDAGLTTAGLLHHFPSKEQLLIAVLVERDRVDSERYHLRGASGLTMLDHLVELVEHNALVPELIRAFTVLMGESVAEDHPAREWFQQRYPRRQRNLADGLRAGVELGEIGEDVDCDAVAAEIIAVMDGLQIQWLLNPEQVNMAAVFAHYIDGVRGAISTRAKVG